MRDFPYSLFSPGKDHVPDAGSCPPLTGPGIRCRIGRPGNVRPDRKQLQEKAVRCLESRHFSEAIRWLTRYIAAYPDPVSLALDAYTPLLAAHRHQFPDFYRFCPNEGRLIEEISVPANFENHLWMAGEMLIDGYDELSWATFHIGLSHARLWVLKNPDPYQALRVVWGMAGYAGRLERYDLLAQSTANLEALVGRLKQIPLNRRRRQNIDGVCRQIRIWRDRIRENHPPAGV